MNRRADGPPSLGKALEVNHLGVRYGEAVAVRDLSLDVAQGEIVGLVGPNGCGKTSTLRAISGLTPRTGVIRVGGTQVSGSPDRVARHGVAHVPEGRGLFWSLTVRENLEVGALAVSRRLAADDLSRILNVFPALVPLLDRRAGLLSGGEQQMVSIGRSLASSPRILMVDELSLGLSPKIVRDLLRALRSVADDGHLALLLVDQNVEALRRICDRTYTIRLGVGVEVRDEDMGALRADYV